MPVKDKSSRVVTLVNLAPGFKGLSPTLYFIIHMTSGCPKFFTFFCNKKMCFKKCYLVIFKGVDMECARAWVVNVKNVSSN